MGTNLSPSAIHPARSVWEGSADGAEASAAAAAAAAGSAETGGSMLSHGFLWAARSSSLSSSSSGPGAGGGGRDGGGGSHDLCRGPPGGGPDGGKGMPPPALWLLDAARPGGGSLGGRGPSRSPKVGDLAEMTAAASGGASALPNAMGGGPPRVPAGYSKAGAKVKRVLSKKSLVEV